MKTALIERHLAGQMLSESPLLGGARLYELPRSANALGEFSFADTSGALGFPALRYALTFDVRSPRFRSEYACRQESQFLICTHGSCRISLFDGDAREEILLNRPDLGLHIPPMVWTARYDFSGDAALLELGSGSDRSTDCIHNLSEYLAAQGDQFDALS